MCQPPSLTNMWPGEPRWPTRVSLPGNLALLPGEKVIQAGGTRGLYRETYRGKLEDRETVGSYKDVKSGASNSHQYHLERPCVGSKDWDSFFLATLWLVMEKAMAPHSSTLAWKIPWMEEPGRLQSMGS